jgi:acetyl-CoA decarbonylase/synthase complex subunit gamma
VEPKLYSIGGQAKENSPLLVTTNFSLTYYTVEPEIINSKIPSWLLVVDTEGLSVLTAWAAEKFTPEVILQSMKKENIDSKVAHRKIIIPGYVAIMSGKLSELTGYEVIVGPREASGIPKFLRTFWKT